MSRGRPAVRANQQYLCFGPLPILRRYSLDRLASAWHKPFLQTSFQYPKIGHGNESPAQNRRYIN